MRLTRWMCGIGLSLFLLGGCSPSDSPATSLRIKTSLSTPQLFTADQVQLIDDFWRPRVSQNADTSWLHIAHELEAYTHNFAKSAGLLSGAYVGNRAGYADSEVYKLLEAAAYLPDNEYIDSLSNSWIEWILQTQDASGYLQTRDALLQDQFTVESFEPEDLNRGGQHRLYNLGHLYEAAVAWRVRKRDMRLWEVAKNSASQLYGAYKRGKLNGLVPLHQEIEIGLIRMGDVSQDTRYWELAAHFLLERGQENKNYPDQQYSQQHAPLSKQSQVVGHAVRALYVYRAMTMLDARLENPIWTDTRNSLWKDLLSHHLYLTGGTGALAEYNVAGRFFKGWEGFGKPYELPHAGYAETCAGVALVLWAREMWLERPDSAFFEVIERAFYNHFIGSISLSGNAFFYQNHLCITADSSHLRKPINGSCCPTNYARLLPQISEFLYAQHADTLFINLYAGSILSIPIGEDSLILRLQTDFPWSGQVKAEIIQAPDFPFTLSFRIPGWANGNPVPSALYQYEEGRDGSSYYSVAGKRESLEDANRLNVSRVWKEGDTISLSFAMPIRKVRAHPSVESCRGQLAFERGPIVYAFEGIDQPKGSLSEIGIPSNATVRALPRTDSLGTYVGIEIGENLPLRAIPYYRWGNRGPTDMLVWIPEL